MMVMMMMMINFRTNWSSLKEFLERIKIKYNWDLQILTETFFIRAAGCSVNEGRE
jgi:hypothetical protein